MAKDIMARAAELSEVSIEIHELLHKNQATLEESVGILASLLTAIHHEVQDDVGFFERLNNAIRVASKEMDDRILN